MKAMEFLTLLGELDDDVLAVVETATETAAETADGTAPAARTVTGKKRRRALWVSVAACLCICCLAFSAWFFIPPNAVTNNALITVVIRVDDRLVSYAYINTDTLSRFERMRLPDTPGEVLCTHGESTFYRAAGEEDLLYIFQKNGDGSYSILEFDHYVPTMGLDLTGSLHYQSGWFTDEDIAALSGTLPTVGDLLTEIYGVTSAEDVKSIRFERDDGYNGGVSKTVRVKTVTVTDGGAVERFYGLLAHMSPAEYGQEPLYDYVDAHDQAYLAGQKPLSAQTDRDVTVTLKSGRKLTLSYHPATGLLRLYGSDMYGLLSEADNQWLIELAGIDTDWRDWGTEEPLVYGEDCETATIPTAPETDQP